MTAPQMVRHQRNAAAAAYLVAQMRVSRQDLREGVALVVLWLTWPARWLWALLVELFEPASVADAELAQVAGEVADRWTRTGELMILTATAQAEGRDAR